MRLITKTTLLYLLLALAVFSIGGVITYQNVRKTVQEETDYALMAVLRLTVKSMKEGTPPSSLENRKIRIEEITAPEAFSPRPVFSDTLAMHFQLERMEQQRKASIVREINGVWYRLSVTDVIIELHDVYDGVLAIMVRLFIFLTISFLIFSFIIQNNLFKPFHQTLQSIRNFTLKGKDQLSFAKTSTKEFSELNEFVQQMTQKARQDYRSLKEFSENASHELQTPLAIAQGKLELLLSSPNLSEEQLVLVQDALTSISRMSRLGTGLGLIAKIENREFQTRSPMIFQNWLTKPFIVFRTYSPCGMSNYKPSFLRMYNCGSTPIWQRSFSTIFLKMRYITILQRAGLALN